MMAESHIPPDLKHFPAYTYHIHANSYFFSIWEAAEGKEFIITHNAFGLWEGLKGGCPDLHRIFMVSPRVAIILRHVDLRPELKEYIKLGTFVSCLLNILPGRGENDSFVFKITKLSQPQTLQFNFILLINVMMKLCALTFLSRESMLSTASKELLIPLITRLTITMEIEMSALCLPSQSLANVLDQDVDTLTLIDEICTGTRRFETAYNRAHLIFKMIQAKPTSFADEVSREVEKALKVCNDLEVEMSINFSPLPSSILNESSSQLFQFMIPCMSRLGAVMSGGEEILEQLQDEVTVVSFLARASSSPGVWHVLSCISPQAPKILSMLFKKTPTDMTATHFARCMYRDQALRSSFSSEFYLAYSLWSIYYQLTASMIQCLARTMLRTLPEPYASQPCERPKARLVFKIPEEHSDFLLSIIKMILQKLLPGYEPSPGGDSLDQTMRKWVEEMAIIGCFAWLGKHRRNFLDWVLDRIPQVSDKDFKLFEDEEATEST
ncbi:hypothetical protein BD769DRAFT_1506418 [Suillus cothurnatus]|nr:hypothetical protein BD769DRAFT_1506418 [Suillus cothurnatus]